MVLTHYILLQPQSLLPKQDRLRRRIVGRMLGIKAIIAAEVSPIDNKSLAHRICRSLTSAWNRLMSAGYKLKVSGTLLKDGGVRLKTGHI